MWVNVNLLEALDRCCLVVIFLESCFPEKYCLLIIYFDLSLGGLFLWEVDDQGCSQFLGTHCPP